MAISVNELMETTDIDEVNEKLCSGWILIETVKCDASRSVKYIIGRLATR